MTKSLLAGLFAFRLMFSQFAYASAAFKDVDKTYRANEEITYLTNKQVINGFPDQSFQQTE